VIDDGMSPLLPAHAMLVLLLSLSACAPSFFGRVRAEPSALETLVMTDAQDRELGSLETAALIVGGALDLKELEQAAREWNTKLAPAIAQTLAMPEAKRPAGLLRALFDTKVLREPAQDANALRDVILHGRYNDVSASLAYMLGAARVGIDARPFLLPSHVRVTVYVDGVPVPVETTNANGFDAPAADGPVVYGEETNGVGLLAAVYSNIAVEAVRHKQTLIGEKIAQRAESLVNVRERKLLQEQRANALAEHALDEKLPLAETLRLGAEARRLANDESLIAAIDEGVMECVLRHAEANASKLSSEGMADIKRALEPFGLADDGHATLLTAVAVWQIDQGALNAAEVTLAQALRVARNPELAEHVRAMNVYRLAQLSEKDPAGAATALTATSFAVGDENAKIVVQNALTALAKAGQCEAQQTAQAQWSALLSADERETLLAYCYNVRGQQLFVSKDYSRLISEMRVAVRTVSKNDTLKKNLVAGLSNQAEVLIGEYRCDAAKPLLQELKTLDPADASAVARLRYCSQR
jgi:hypothetical protein